MQLGVCRNNSVDDPVTDWQLMTEKKTKFTEQKIYPDKVDL